jgi:hypothetical protein
MVALLLVVPLLLGTTYKWRDASGQLQLTDTPPPPGVAYEVMATPRGPAHPAASAMPAPGATTPTVSVAPSEPPPAVDDAEPAARNAELDRRCVEALYQLELLGMKLRVFRQGPDDTRVYLDDRDRPAEIERLTWARNEACVGDEAHRAESMRKADQLLQSLSPGCREDRERLEFMRRDPRTPRRDLEAREARVNQRCPEVPDPANRDLWLGDWILVR